RSRAAAVAVVLAAFVVRVAALAVRVVGQRVAAARAAQQPGQQRARARGAAVGLGLLGGLEFAPRDDRRMRVGVDDAAAGGLAEIGAALDHVHNVALDPGAAVRARQALVEEAAERDPGLTSGAALEDLAHDRRGLLVDLEPARALLPLRDLAVT